VHYYFWHLDPYGYHLTNVILQIFVSILVLLFIYNLSGKAVVSLAASLLFALNPLNTEVVSYVSGRAELLLGLFLLSSLLLFIKSLKGGSGRRVIQLNLSFLLFIFALLSKELAVVFPLAILAFVFYFKRSSLKDRGFIFKKILPFFIILAIYLGLRLSLLRFPTIRPPELLKFPLILRITALPEVILTYLKLLILPVNLHMSRTLGIPEHFIGIFILWFLLGVIVAGCAYTLIYKRDNRNAAFLLCWSLLFLMPQAGIYPINAFVAEHFIYLSSISFFMLVVYLLRRYLRNTLFAFSIIGLLIFYGSLTASRNFEWRNPRLFYEGIIRVSGNSFQAHNNLGLQYEYSHMYDKAISEYKKALEINPGLLEGHSNLANIYFKTGRLKEAKDEYAIVQRTAPGSKAGEIQNNLGCIYEIEGRTEEALDKYRLALRLDPGLKFTHFNIARIYFLKRDFPAAGREINS